MYVHEDKAHEVSAAIVKAEHSAKSERLECWDQAGGGGLGPCLQAQQVQVQLAGCGNSRSVNNSFAFFSTVGLLSGDSMLINTKVTHLPRLHFLQHRYWAPGTLTRTRGWCWVTSAMYMTSSKPARSWA